MKVLIVSYYWPPSGGVGVLRWLHFSRTLAENEFEITVVHPSGAAYSQIDEELKSIIHQNIKTISVPIREPQNLLNQLKTTKQQAKTGNEVFQKRKSFVSRLILKIRANLFIPDAKMLWISPTVKRCKELLSQEQYDILITNGPPHSCHLIGLQLKRHFKDIKWVADFRDPWQEIDYFAELPMSNSTKKKHHQLEQDVLLHADAITTVSPSWKELFEEKGAKHVEVFTNGYSTKDFNNLVEKNPTTSPMIRHVGTLDKDRNAENLWKAIQKTNCTIELVGSVDSSIQEQVKPISTIFLEGNVSHKKAIQLMISSDILLLCNSEAGANKGRIPAKLFEYIACKKPILYFGRLDNDACKIIQTHQLGICLPYLAREEEIIQAIEQLCNFKLPEATIEQFSRNVIAEEYGIFLRSL